MIGSDAREVERKVISILKILQNLPEPLGSRIIARRLKDYGVDLSERAVRYHLQLMDQRGLTELVSRDGRLITPAGREELDNALVGDKVGFVITRIELLAFRTTFDWQKRTGLVPINVSIYAQKNFPKALKVMKEAFASGLCVSELVYMAEGGEQLGNALIPRGSVGLATVCSIIVNGALLKAGIPMDSRFGGILQMRGSKPLRFVELIHYEGSSLDPSEVFIRGKMTSVREVARGAEGKVLANFREIPAECLPLAESVVAKLKEARLGGVLLMGNVSEPVCEVPVSLNRVGVILLGGLNPVAAAEEAGIEAENTAMGGVIEYTRLKSVWEL